MHKYQQIAASSFSKENDSEHKEDTIVIIERRNERH